MATQVHGPDHRAPHETASSPPGLLVSDYFEAFAPYHVLRTRGTRDWLLTWTIDGCGLYQQPDEGVQLECRPGDLVLLEPGAYHDYGCIPGQIWAFVWAHFIARPHWMQWMPFPSVGRGLRRLKVHDAGTRERIRIAFFRCYADGRSGTSALLQGLALNALEEVILLGAREQALSSRELPLSPEIRKAVEFMVEHLAEPHSVHQLSRKAGLSPSRFAHRFKAETGDSVIAYLLKLRLCQAARLLEFSGRSIKEVAGDVGFESPFYFSRQFHKHFKMSPRAYTVSRRGF